MRSYRVELSPAAARAFKRLPGDVRDTLRSTLLELARAAARPDARGANSTKIIRGTTDTFHRLRVGDYRVMYDLMDGDAVVLILGIVNRRDLQKWLRNR